MSNLIYQVEKLIRNAGKADTADNAMKFSQAAQNASNALAVLESIKKEEK